MQVDLLVFNTQFTKKCPNFADLNLLIIFSIPTQTNLQLNETSYVDSSSIEVI